MKGIRKKIIHKLVVNVIYGLQEATDVFIIIYNILTVPSEILNNVCVKKSNGRAPRVI